MVAAPPSSVGKFGGETDNWMWPRHTGDFSLFRIYADANGEPAEYNATTYLEDSEIPVHFHQRTERKRLCHDYGIPPAAPAVTSPGRK